MDPVRAQRILWFLAALGFGMAILGAVGELRGWWNDVGEVLMGVGTLLGVVMAAASVTTGASHEQVRAVNEGVGIAHAKLDSMDGKLDKLDVIEEALVEDRDDGRVSKLDVVQAELNAQTGALKHQVRILEDIREAV